MEDKRVDYEFLIMDYLKSYRLYHSYKETISMMKKIINKEHIPIFTEDLKNNSDELNTVYFAIYNSKENKCFDYMIHPGGKNKLEKKQDVIKNIKERFYEICK